MKKLVLALTGIAFALGLSACGKPTPEQEAYIKLRAWCDQAANRDAQICKDTFRPGA